jgi:hypothetical protein
MTQAPTERPNGQHWTPGARSVYIADITGPAPVMPTVGIVYTKLREACLSKELQEEYPDWPFPLLFHGEEISRDIFFLDPVIEWGPLQLGRNPVRDASFLRYRSLNQWFHYRFFNGLNFVVNSAETVTLLPRIFRLRSLLLDNLGDSTLESFLQREFSITNPKDLIASWLQALSRITDIALKHALVVWGMRIDEGAPREHMDYVQKISLIRADLVLDLPHLRALKLEWEEARKIQQRAYRNAEARYNKRRKHERRFQPGVCT